MKTGWTIHHNGPLTGLTLSTPHALCQKFWKNVEYWQTEHPKGPGWSDIAYSWGVCPHGIPLMGRGWFKNQFANGKDVVPPYNGKDSDYYTVMAFIGWNPDTGYEEKPTAKMIDGIARLIDESRDRGYCGLTVLSHNQFKWKRCPGLVLTNLAHQWNGKPFPPIPAATLEKDDDMLIIDCPGEPALVLGAGDVKKINVEQRNALRTIGVLAKQVDTATSRALASIVD